MANLHEIPPFPNPGVRLIKEDAHVAFGKKCLNPAFPPHPTATCVITSPSSPTAES